MILSTFSKLSLAAISTLLFVVRVSINHTMARSSLFPITSALNAFLLICIILKHVAIGVARSTVRHACMVVLFPVMLLHILIIEG